MNGVQLSQGCRATTRRGDSLILATQCIGAPGTSEG